MEQSYKKRPPRATANSPPGLPDMGEFYFINLSKSVDFFIVLSQTHFLKQYLIFPHVVNSHGVIYIFRMLGP